MIFFSKLSVLPWASLALIAFGFWAYLWQRARASELPRAELNSLPDYHGQLALLWTIGPPLALLLIYALFGSAWLDYVVRQALPANIADQPPLIVQSLMSDAAAIAEGKQATFDRPQTQEIVASYHHYRIGLHLFTMLGVLVLAAIGMGFSLRRPIVDLRARAKVERALQAFLLLASVTAVATTIGIVYSLIGNAIRFFQVYSPLDFLFGLTWSPQTAIRTDQIGQTGAFGAVKLFYGTLAISVVAIAVAAPIGLFSAIYLAEYAHGRVRAIVKPALEMLAGIPSVVYGFFAAFTFAPFVRDCAAAVGLSASPQNMLSAGVVMGVMIIPLVSSLTDDVISAVPNSLRDGSYALGATKSETVGRVVIPAALPGIVGALLLAISRALGETMIVAMAAGQRAQITVNPLEEVTTVTVWIVELLTGDQEFDSAKTLSAFALGFVLFLVTLTTNIISLRIVQKFREKYD